MIEIPANIEQMSEEDFKKWLRTPSVMIGVCTDPSLRDKIREARYRTKIIQSNIDDFRTFLTELSDYVMCNMTGVNPGPPKFVGFSGGDSSLEGTDKEIMLSRIDLDKLQEYRDSNPDADPTIPQLHELDIATSYLIRSRNNGKELAFCNGDDVYRWVEVPEDITDLWNNLHAILPDYAKFRAGEDLDMEENEPKFKMWFVHSEPRYGTEEEILKEVQEARSAYYAKIIMLKKEEMSEEGAAAFHHNSIVYLRETAPKDLKEYFGSLYPEIHIINK